MGLFAHTIHLHITDKNQGRVLAGALLKSSHSLVICPPYGSWLNVYLPMGLSYKDVPEFPTCAYIELNCYDGEGFDLRLYAADRLAFLFESGCNEVTEHEDFLMEIAERLWSEDPNRPTPTALVPEGEEASAKAPDFWDLEEAQQERYIQKARESAEFNGFLTTKTSSDIDLPDPECFGPYLPEGRTLSELRLLLMGTSRRLVGPPLHELQVRAMEKYMGKLHSEKADDYLRAFSKFFRLRASDWSLEVIQEKLADKIDRRIVPLEVLEGGKPE